MEKVLYVSDLDGTLIRSDEMISQYSCSVINDLVQRGMLFSYATARSLITAAAVTDGLKIRLPVIVYNGAFIIDSSSKEILISNFFSEHQSNYIKTVLSALDIYPIIYSYIEGTEKFSYHKDLIKPEMKFFLNSRKNDVRQRPIDSFDDLYRGSTFYFTCIGRECELAPAYEILKHNTDYNCHYLRDIYSKDQWLEILPSKATKANAIIQLKNYLGCDKVISFGDAKNDVSMFQISDECYAVENADDDLKAIATGIIGSNEVDSVARWLSENY